MLKSLFHGFTKEFAKYKRAILLASVKKGLTVMECCRNHPFFRITPKVNRGTDAAFDSERRVLRCDNGLFQMVITKFSWLYLGFRSKCSFFLVVNSTLTLRSTAVGLTCLQLIFIWGILNVKSFIVSSNAPLFKRPYLWRYNQKTQESLERIPCPIFSVTSPLINSAELLNLW